jgi:hypothetical protein
MGSKFVITAADRAIGVAEGNLRRSQHALLSRPEFHNRMVANFGKLPQSPR